MIVDDEVQWEILRIQKLILSRCSIKIKYDVKHYFSIHNIWTFIKHVEGNT